MDDVHPQATIRHRQFETAMDLYFWQDGRKGHWLGNRLSSVDVSRRDLLALLADLYRAEPLGGVRAVKKALRWHMGIQYLFFARWMKVIMAACDRAGRPLSGKATGLVYPFPRGLALPFFDGSILFSDPCTGEKHQTSIKEMVQEVVTGTLAVLALAAQCLEQDRPLSQCLLDVPGLPRVRPGLPAEGSHVWNEEINIMPRIYRGVSPPF